MEGGDDIRVQLGLQKWEECEGELVFLMSSAETVDSSSDEGPDGRAISFG